MPALLDDAAVAHDEDEVRLADGGQAVGDQERRAVAQQVVDGVLDKLLRLRVDGGRRLVEHEDARIGQHGARKGDQLLFARGQAVAALADVAVPALFELGRDLIGRNGPRRCLDLGVRGVQTAVADVLADRAGEQVRILQHIADVRVQPQLAALAVVPAVDEDLAGGRLKKAAGEVHKRALARAGLADDGDGRSGGDFQREVRQHVLAAVRVAERDVAELDVAAQRLPVFALGVEGIAVAGDDLRRVGDLRLFVQQARHALNGGLQRDEFCDVRGRHLDRLENADGVGREGRERGDLQHLLLHHIAAAQQHDGHGRRGAEQHEGDIHGVQPRGTDAAVVHLLCQRTERGRVLLLDAEGLRRLRAGDALVERAGDAGVQLADAAVPVQDAILKIAREDGDDRHDDDNDKGELPVEQQHRGERAEHIEHGPEDIRQVPRDHGGDARGVAHDAAEQIAHRRDVIERERQRLQVREEVRAHVAPGAHLDLHGVARKGHNGQGLQQDDAEIAQRVGQQARQRPGLDII